MTRPPRDSAAVRIPPPLLFVAAIGLGLALERWGWRLPLPFPRGVRIATATGLAILGGVPLIAAMGQFFRTGQQPEPWKPTPAIITTGIYRWTRNPMYIGLALLQAAAGFGRDSVWVLALVPVALAGVYWTAVRHEEAYLERKFGAPYLDYKRSVRRWL